MASNYICAVCGDVIVEELDHTYFGGYSSLLGHICESCCESCDETPRTRFYVDGKIADMDSQ